MGTPSPAKVGVVWAAHLSAGPPAHQGVANLVAEPKGATPSQGPCKLVLDALMGLFLPMRRYIPAPRGWQGTGHGPSWTR